MVFDIGMPNIAVNLLDGAFEIVKHKKDNETRSIFWDLKGKKEGAKVNVAYKLSADHIWL